MYLTQFLHRALQQRPDSSMTVFENRIHTVREGTDRVARLAAGLRGLGVDAGDRVAVLALNSDRTHEMFLACWWLGAAPNPVNVRWSAAEIAHSLSDAEPAAMMIDEHFLELVAGLDDLPTLIYSGTGAPSPGMTAYESLIENAEPLPDTRTGGDALALLLYTGGTTGYPKGVMISHRSLMASTLGTLASGRSAIGGGSNLNVNPMFHIAGIVGWMQQNVLGGTQVFLPAFTPDAFLRAIDTYRPSVVGLVPTTLQMLVSHKNASNYDLSSVQVVRYGASPISPSLLERAMTLFPECGFSQGYGMTETAHISMLGTEEHTIGGDLLRSAGMALPHCEIRIVDPDGAQVAPGEIGEVTTRGDHVMLGYWKRQAETDEVLRDGWMHTGDAGYLDDRGYLFVVDRIKDMIVTGGENVYSTEVENALTKHEAVATCSVVGVPDPVWGERVHAFVVLRADIEPGNEPTTDTLRAHTKSLIAGYKAPRSVQYVDVLPTSAAGKTLKAELRRIALAEAG